MAEELIIPFTGSHIVRNNIDTDLGVIALKKVEADIKIRGK